ncbi:Putative transposase Y4QJ [Stappia aggregata IAM 12614]|uniref:Putative transposase Y4QJ n=1 Tax=Roseibium aggregatum (strain ATCC 25650 / DSM 13394 / JCM 20685 / NBRC 16684 / NCIMB 2208 / IAM 12614 / B1) TaxID=384765 RepID=A0P0Y4_ROSAI|nr:IS91 family transposase [Roseibium aggregatum]EAV40140.1 Putative transposase Y4QJ [Stappia aggregata IAM 12614] [Roseibium aggregatum IAM 12614]EAV40703.1 Putative transposase Y4QJ [Stappia aggregata IAM 12614] [Roseibium aggregatum IAM 12614]EAV41448.1 Putative transposase Y4QJ [Stappia aggregata IAM 12614] [Roseibium aggregatum IAM 12614]
MSARLEVADIFRRHGEAYRQAHHGHLGRVERRVMSAIELCRTAALGGHIEECRACGAVRVAYNSCRNRHCPKCQTAVARDWLAARASELLPVPYFHVVFTLPAEIAAVAFQNKAVVYTILFRTAAETLRTIAADPRHLGAEIGLIAVLHSWGQTLTYHPHLHCIVPGGGPSPDGSRWISCRPGFFLAVRVLSRLFRRLFLEALRVAFEAGGLQFFGSIADLAGPAAFARLLAAARRRDWVVYAKPPFGGPEQVLAYLGRYTHRVAIANSRLVSLADGKVTFRWRDYRHGRKTKLMTLKADEFIRRFLLHTLPDGFHRIRHYGFLANGRRVARLASCRQLLAVRAPETAFRAEPVTDLPSLTHPCPCCGSPMITLAVWHHGQAPPPRSAWNDSS